MLYFYHGYISCLYVPFYLVGDACAQIVVILLVFLSFLACCSALCISEKHMLAFVDLIHALPASGRKVPNSCFQGEFCIKGRKFVRHAFVQGELAFMHLGALFCLNFSVLFCRWCRALLLHLEESAIVEHFISVVSSHCPCLRGPRSFSLK
jgi:hypothetical protein